MLNQTTLENDLMQDGTNFESCKPVSTRDISIKFYQIINPFKIHQNNTVNENTDSSPFLNQSNTKLFQLCLGQ